MADRSSLFLILILVLLSISFTAAALVFPPDIPNNETLPNLIYYNTGKTPKGSKFLKNLIVAITFLYKSNPPNGYATTLGYGDFPHTAYAHSGCYKMPDQISCSDCIKRAYTDFQQVAPLTVGARNWINDTDNRCYLRFEAYSFRQELIRSGTIGVLGPNGTIKYSDSLFSFSVTNGKT